MVIIFRSYNKNLLSNLRITIDSWPIVEKMGKFYLKEIGKELKIYNLKEYLKKRMKNKTKCFKCGCLEEIEELWCFICKNCRIVLRYK